MKARWYGQPKIHNMGATLTYLAITSCKLYVRKNNLL